MADETLEYKCPCCGGAIEFNSTVQKMKCPYCDTEFDIETLKAYDEELKKDNESNDNLCFDTNTRGKWQEGETEDMRVYLCKSCGGEIIANENTGATSCPYCGNPVVMTGKFSGALKPNYIIPFKLDKKAAKEALKEHMMGKKLLPKVFKNENHIEEVKGIYVPFWLFDAEADANIRYKATKKRHFSDSNYNYTETSYFLVSRSGSIGFQNVPVDGSKLMPDDLMESIEPFDFNEAVDFNLAYLAGFLADKYDVDSNECINRVNERVKESTEDSFRNTVKGYSSVICENSNINFKNGKAKYVVYPVWVLNTKWKDKNYLFAMNGQTGKFVGNMPVDMKAFFKFFFGFTILFAVIIYGIMWVIALL